MFGHGVQINPESELGKELAKWNKPYVYQAFPKMLYKARMRPDGIVRCIEVEDRFFNGVVGAAEQWSMANTFVAKNEDELLKMKGQGWVEGGPIQAVEAFISREEDEAKEAAHRSWDDRNMGEKAKEEIKAAEDATEFHVAEVPEKRKVRKQRSDKGQKRVTNHDGK